MIFSRLMLDFSPIPPLREAIRDWIKCVDHIRIRDHDPFQYTVSNPAPYQDMSRIGISSVAGTL